MDRVKQIYTLIRDVSQLLADYKANCDNFTKTISSLHHKLDNKEQNNPYIINEPTWEFSCAICVIQMSFKFTWHFLCLETNIEARHGNVKWEQSLTRPATRSRSVTFDIVYNEQEQT